MLSLEKKVWASATVEAVLFIPVVLPSVDQTATAASHGSYHTSASFDKADSAELTDDELTSLSQTSAH